MDNIGIFEWLFDRSKPRRSGRAEELVIRDMMLQEGLELQFREMAFWSCVNLIANILSKCEIKTFEYGKQIRGTEWYMWNVKPNANQSAAVFWHRFVAEAYMRGDVLIVKEPYGNGVVVADDFAINDDAPVRRYESISIGKQTIRRRDPADVIYFRPNYMAMNPIIEKMSTCYLRLMATAMQAYQFNAGQHWKVHVDQMADAQEDKDEEGRPQEPYEETMRKLIENQIAPFLNSRTGVLPEFEGYQYTQLSGQDPSKVSTKEVRELATEIFRETGRGFLIPEALTVGGQQDTTSARKQLMEDVIDPLARQAEQAINGSRYSPEEFLRGSRVRIDTSNIGHFDIFANAANVEKLIGSGIKSVNELRALIGDDPIPEEWADKHFLTLNIGAVERADGSDKTKNGGDKQA